MGKLRFAPYAFGLAAALVLGTNPIGVQAAPLASKGIEVSFEDLDIQGKIMYTAAEEVSSPFYMKGISTAQDCVMIRKEPKADSEAVGKLYNGAGFEVLEKGTEWIRIQSGSCEGYVSAEYVVTGKDAEEIAETTDSVNSYVKVVAEQVEIKAQPSDDAEVLATVAGDVILDIVEVIPESEWTKVQGDGVEGYVKDHTIEVGVNYNSAISMEEEAQIESETEADIEETQIESETEADIEETESDMKEESAEEAHASEENTGAEEETEKDTSLYIEDRNETVWATETVNVRANANSGAAIVGSLSKGAGVTRTGVCENGWSRVDYDGTTAYIHSDYLTTSEPEEPVYNNSSNTGSSLGQQMIDFARQFIGNPYVYGGTSLTNGADCSGFVQSIYSNFGYSIPRTCTTQFAYGRQISMDEIQPGDLLMYSYYGEIEHVALYTGEGTIVHASNEDTGIIETPMDYGGYPSHAIRILE